jgi:hypothetical protein
MREEARRGIDAGEGSGALAASSMTRSKSSSAGVFRTTDKADRGHRARAQDADRVTELCAFLSLLQVCLSSDERFDYSPSRRRLLPLRSRPTAAGSAGSVSPGLGR